MSEDLAGPVPVAEHRQITVLGDEVTAVQLADGSIYLPLRALCTVLGLDRAA